MTILSGLLVLWVALALPVPFAGNAGKHNFFVHIGSSKSDGGSECRVI